MERGFLPNGIELFPRLAKVGRALGHLLVGPNKPLASHGDHFVEPRGAAAQLDRELYDQPQHTDEVWGMVVYWDLRVGEAEKALSYAQEQRAMFVGKLAIMEGIEDGGST